MYTQSTQEDLGNVLQLIAQAPEMNAHLSTILMRYGITAPSAPVFVYYEHSSLRGLACLINGGAIVYESGNLAYHPLLNLLVAQGVKSVTGPAQILLWLQGQLKRPSLGLNTTLELTTLAIYEGQGPVELSTLWYPRPYTRGILSEKIQLHNEVFSLKIPLDHEGIYQLFDQGRLKGYVIHSEGRLLACGEWLDEHPDFGLIVGIATDSAFRRRGLAQAISEHLLNDILSAQKVPLLRYSDFRAQYLYKKLGFKPIGEFGTLYFHE